MPKKPKVRGAKTVAQMRAKLKRTRARSSKTGRIVKKAYAKKHPATTQIETVKEAGPFVGTFGFDIALRALKQRLRVRRTTWSENVYLAMPNDSSMHLCTLEKPPRHILWTPGVYEILSENWEIVP